ncbi:MAG: ABC transporter permease [Clostridia bacterium]|nr:ABC transporter permease [Clostridia bacterium]
MKSGRVTKALSNTYLALILALLYMPIILVVIFSFSGNSVFSFSKGLTLQSYIMMFRSVKLVNALKNTLIIGGITSVVSTILGSISAIGIYYLKPRWQKITLSINQLPMINSEIVMAVALMIFFITLRIPQGYPRLLLGHISFCTPYVVLSILPRLSRMDPNLYEAALDLGASPFTALFKIIIPYIMPAVLSGFVMAFTISIDDFIITQLNKGETGIETLATCIWEDMRVGGLEPYWFAVSSIIFVLVLLAVLLGNYTKNTREVNQE